ncbi:uncharacterized protein LOC103854943 [Brassica rapa]|uniref:uncharacterized protein LOC103854943 n=1 Tax=Brassica campestris TaxID=3711 RepID=UPI00142E4F95|nr:uncharacterized protein LOC103854943 [Brassica rapa]
MSETIPIISFLCDLPVIAPRSVKQSVWILRSAISSSTAFDRAARTAMASATSGDPTNSSTRVSSHTIGGDEPENVQASPALFLSFSQAASVWQMTASPFCCLLLDDVVSLSFCNMEMYSFSFQRPARFLKSRLPSRSKVVHCL